MNVAHGWRTIMAYNTDCEDAGTSCTRLQYWSNPDITYGGDPMGIADPAADAADNRTTLNNTRTTVQQFRAAHAPTADAGPDQNAECGVPTTLDGSGSCDPDDDPLTYSWTGGCEEGGGTASGVMPLVTFPKGVFEVSLVVNDGLISSVPDTVIRRRDRRLHPAQHRLPRRRRRVLINIFQGIGNWAEFDGLYQPYGMVFACSRSKEESNFWGGDHVC